MNKIVEKAMEIKKYSDAIPNLEIGDNVDMAEVWDGNGETPECAYSYFLTDEGEDGEGHYDVSINYEFEIVEKSEDPLKTKVIITDINLI